MKTQQLKDKEIKSIISDLGNVLNEAISFGKLRKEISKYTVMSPAEEQGKFILYQKTKKKGLRDELVKRNLKLVIQQAEKYKYLSGGDVDELFQQGVVELTKIIDTFDPKRGFRFSTYATPKIRAAVKDYGGKLIRPKKRGEVPAEIETKEGIVSKIDRFISQTDPGPEDLMINRIEARRLLSKLSGNERKVLEMKFLKQMTLSQIGKKLGVTYQRAGQIVNDAMEKLKKYV